jgi:hypothetical protein
MQISQMIRELGGGVVGPASSVAAAEDLLTSLAVDGAVVDVRMGHVTSAPLIDRLLTLGVPVTLTTGCSEDLLPEHLVETPRFSKPYTKCDFEEKVKRHLPSDGHGASRTAPTPT